MQWVIRLRLWSFTKANKSENCRRMVLGIIHWSRLLKMDTLTKIYFKSSELPLLAFWRKKVSWLDCLTTMHICTTMSFWTWWSQITFTCLLYHHTPVIGCSLSMSGCSAASNMVGREQCRSLLGTLLAKGLLHCFQPSMGLWNYNRKLSRRFPLHWLVSFQQKCHSCHCICSQWHIWTWATSSCTSDSGSVCTCIFCQWSVYDRAWKCSTDHFWTWATCISTWNSKVSVTADSASEVCAVVFENAAPWYRSSGAAARYSC